MLKHTYAVFYQTLTGKKRETHVSEIDYSPTKIITIAELPKVKEAVSVNHPNSEIEITGMMYLRSRDED